MDKVLAPPAVLIEDSRKTAATYRNLAWVAAKGDTTLRLDYPLDERSVVFDVGGFKGEWTYEISKRYRCEIHVFEPVPAYFTQLKERFGAAHRITVHPFGLGRTTSTARIGVFGDTSSTFREALYEVECKIENCTDFILENRIPVIHLMKVNIEGGEYDLLEGLIESGVVDRVVDLQVQFHDFLPDAGRRMKGIQTGLSETHYLTYQHEYVWENWRHRLSGQEPVDLRLHSSELSDLVNRTNGILAELRRENIDLRLLLNRAENEKNVFQEAFHMTAADVATLKQSPLLKPFLYGIRIFAAIVKKI